MELNRRVIGRKIPMRQQVLCAEGYSPNEAEENLNKRLKALGTNWMMTSVQGSMTVTSAGKHLVLLTAMTSLTSENNIREIEDLGLEPDDTEALVRMMAELNYTPSVGCLIGSEFKMWTKIKNPRLGRIELVLAKNGLRFERPRRSEQ